tara:strand:+ start:353 stop:520 length:168 start_codon:yes stop_codon:yes gene_type:complete
MQVGDKVLVRGKTGDLGGEYTVLKVWGDSVVVKHPDYSVTFLVKAEDCVKSLNKS